MVDSSRKFTRARLVNLASPAPPIDPILGEIWVDTSGDQPLLRIWNGNSWSSQGSGDSGDSSLGLIIALS